MRWREAGQVMCSEADYVKRSVCVGESGMSVIEWGRWGFDMGISKELVKNDLYRNV